MPEIDIDGVPVSFPYEPYDCQLQFLQTLMRSLQEGKNALLESPTGTGKTLCLLCGVLAWRQTMIAKIQLSKLNDISFQSHSKSNPRLASIYDSLGNAVGTFSAKDTSLALDIPKIYYASRTHSQLKQVVKELRKISYRPKVCILASREQSCIHPQVQKIPSSTVQNAACRKVVLAKQCQFYRNANTSSSGQTMLSGELMDLEDLLKFGKAHSACPYYLSREQLANADIVLLPYNYLFSKASRESQGISLVNSIIIIDEAHNLEGHCSESTSVDFSLQTLQECVKESDSLVKFSKTLKYTGSFGPEYFELLKEVLQKTIVAFDSISFVEGRNVSFAGDYIFKLLREQVGLDKEKVGALVTVIQDGITNYTSIEASLNCHLEVFERFLKGVWRDEISSENQLNWERENCKYFRLILQRDEKGNKSVGYWCLNPGIVMRELVFSAKIRNMILTSGTLSPMESFALELQIPFPYQLENGHVICKEQLLVGVLPAGPFNIPLNSSYANRSNPSYKNELGSAILKVITSIPGGVLAFFPSYSSLTECIQYWKNNGTYDLMNAKKKIFVESKDKTQFTSIVQMFSNAAENSREGSLLFAVCRGKASEGIDFGDEKARAVIITGIPYPSFTDPKVELKKKFLDSSQSSLSGADWYNQQASRAVNQAIGRVIRHYSDYGAILLFDEKFASTKNISHLPLWLRSRVHIYTRYGELQNDLEKFYQLNVEKKYSRHILNECNNSSDSVKRFKANHCEVRNEETKSFNSKHQFVNSSENIPVNSKDMKSNSYGSNIIETNSLKAITLNYPIVIEELEQNNSSELKMKSISTLFSCKRSQKPSIASYSADDRIKITCDLFQQAKSLFSLNDFSVFEDLFIKYTQCSDINYENILRNIHSHLLECNQMNIFDSLEIFINENHFVFYQTLQQQKSSSDLKCPVCNESNITEPMYANCKHCCCRKCWDEVLKVSFECPTCNEKVRPSHLRKK